MNIRCKNCEHECSEKAKACPHCGHPLAADPLADLASAAGRGSQPATSRRKRTPRKHFPLGMGLTYALALAMIGVGLIMFWDAWDTNLIPSSMRGPDISYLPSVLILWGGASLHVLVEIWRAVERR